MGALGLFNGSHVFTQNNVGTNLTANLFFPREQLKYLTFFPRKVGEVLCTLPG